MTTITLDEKLDFQLNQVAKQAHISVEQIVNNALRDYLEDYLDTIAGEQALARIENGEDKLLSLEEAEKLLHDLAD